MDIWNIIPSLVAHSFTSKLLLIGLGLLSFWYFSSKPWRKRPPGPFALPFVGSLPFLPDKNFRVASLQMRKKYGDVIGLKLGPMPGVILCGYDVIKEALLKNGATFSTRPVDYVQQRLSNNTGVIGNNGESQQLQRRFVLRVLRDSGFGKKDMDNIILDEVHQLLEEMERHVNLEYNLNIPFKKATSNVINVLAFGQRHSYDDPVFIQSMKLVEELFTLFAPGRVLSVLPILRHLPGDLFGFKRFNTVVEQLKINYRSWIVRRRNSLRDGEEPSDLIARYLMEIEKHKDDPTPEFTEEHLVSIISDLFLAGTDTSSSTMNWITLYLALYPDMQEKIYLEIIDVIGSERAPSTNDRSQLSYTEAFIAETLRMSSVAPFALPHCTSEDIVFRGYYIQKGTLVAVCTHSVDMDPAHWVDPELFNPTRFLDKHGKYKKREEQILFSLGKRSCVGEGLARNEIFLFLVCIVRRFRVRLPKDRPTPSTEGTQGGIRNPHPYNVILERREA